MKGNYKALIRKTNSFLIVLFLLLPGVMYAQGTVVADSFFSNALGSIRHMRVYLPEGYDTTAIDYPVIYFLHGGNADHTWYSSLYAVLDSLIGNQIIQPVIVVKPDGSVGPYAGSCYVNSELYGNFADYIVYDLVEYIDATYRTIPERNKRCLMGHSMGGNGSLQRALEHPDLYQGAASHSGVVDVSIALELWAPYILSENGGSPPYYYTPSAGNFTYTTFTFAGAYSPDTTDAPYFVDFPLDSMGDLDSDVYARWRLHDVPRLAAQMPPDTNLAIYFDCGMQDEIFCYPQNTALAESLDALGISYEFQSYTGNHSNQLRSRYPMSLTFLDSAMNFTGISEDKSTETMLNLLEISPNPFTKLTEIRYLIGDMGYEIKNTTLRIYDATGRLVKDLSCSMPNALGPAQISWDGTDQANRPLSSGVYFLKLAVSPVGITCSGGKTEKYTERRKVLLIK